MPRRFLPLTARLNVLCSFVLTAVVHAQPQDTGGACIPVSERAGRPFGCFIVDAQPVGVVESGANFWHLETFPTRAAAEKQKGPRGKVHETFGRVWLLTIGPESQRTPGAEHVAAIGPLPVTDGRAYTAQYMEAVFRPGMKSLVHSHAGPEAFYTISGETCLESPAGRAVSRSGGAGVIIPDGPMELTATGTETRRSLVLILHDSARPHTSPVPEWTPKGLCKS